MSTLKVNALQDTSGKGFYPARAWVNFNGTGTVAINDDSNVSSISDGGTGTYTVTFNNGFSNANFSAPAATGRGSDASNTNRTGLVRPMTTSTALITHKIISSGSSQDVSPSCSSYHGN